LLLKGGCHDVYKCSLLGSGVSAGDTRYV
jgi:hypothetical protein